MSNIQNSQNRSRSGRLLALLALAQLIISVDYNIVYVALPEIGLGTGLSGEQLQWVISAYAVAFGGFLLLGGRLTDARGASQTFIAGLSLYGMGSLLGGLASDPALLLTARAVQGLGGALLFPATLTLVSTRFDEGRDRRRAYAVWATAGGSGMILGSLLGGVLTQLWGWEAVFFVNVPLVAIAIGASRKLIAAEAPRTRRRTVNLAGSLTATAGFTAGILAIIQGPELGWTSPVVVTSMVSAVAFLALFVMLERASADPLIPARLLRTRDLKTGSVITFLYMGTFGTLLYFLTLYFQDVRDFSPMSTGLAFLPPMAAIVTGSQTAGHVVARFGLRSAMVTSLLVGGIGAAVVAATISTDGSYASMVPGLLIMGLGQGAGYTLMFQAATQHAPATDQGVASGVVSTAQQLGGVAGLAILVGLSEIGAGTGSGAAVDGLRVAMLAAAGGIGLTALLALRLAQPSVVTTEGTTHVGA